MNTSYINHPIGIPTEEGRLIRQAKSGNEYAFAQLYDACVEQIYNYISFRVANDRVTEAITIQVFFKAWEQLDHYEVFGSSFVMWLYSIAQNRVTAYYLKHKQLKPFLRTVFLPNRGREGMPSPTFAAFARFALIEHARSHPRQQRARQQQGVALSWRTAMTLATLVVAFLVTGTVHAQSALPGDVDYGWKRTSELAWRALAPDPVAADIILSERRLDEWIAVANDPALNTSARNSYRDALSRLESSRDVKTVALIVPALQLQQQALKNAGLPTSELDNYLAGMLTPVVIPVTGVQPAATDVPPLVTEIPQITTDVQPIATEIPQVVTDVPQITTDVPAEVVPNDCASNCGDHKGSDSKGSGKKNGDGKDNKGGDSKDNGKDNGKENNGKENNGKENNGKNN